MKQFKMCAVVLSFGILFASGCKKAGTSSDNNPVTPNTVVTNAPPAGGDYWLTAKPELSGNFSVFWTQDFVRFYELSSELRGTYQIYLSGDTVLFKQSVVSGSSGGVSLRYAPTSNPLNFKSVSPSKGVEYAGVVNGTIVTLSQDGNNYYRGYCNVQNGETSFHYQSLDNSSLFTGIYRVGSTLISNVTAISSGAYLGYTKDGVNWTVTNGPGTSSAAYYDVGSTTVAFNSFGRLYTTQGVEFSSATWTEVGLSNANTTDTAGFFDTQFSTFVTLNSAWKVYGYITSSATGQKIPAVNISTNQGATWKTTLLTGTMSRLTGGDYPTHIYLVSKNLMLIYIGYDTPKIFKSTNGIDFSVFLSGQAASDMNAILNTTVYIN